MLFNTLIKQTHCLIQALMDFLYNNNNNTLVNNNTKLLRWSIFLNIHYRYMLVITAISHHTSVSRSCAGITWPRSVEWPHTNMLHQHADCHSAAILAIKRAHPGNRPPTITLLLAAADRWWNVNKQGERTQHTKVSLQDCKTDRMADHRMLCSWYSVNK